MPVARPYLQYKPKLIGCLKDLLFVSGLCTMRCCLTCCLTSLVLVNERLPQCEYGVINAKHKKSNDARQDDDDDRLDDSLKIVGGEIKLHFISQRQCVDD